MGGEAVNTARNVKHMRPVSAMISLIGGWGFPIRQKGETGHGGWQNPADREKDEDEIAVEAEDEQPSESIMEGLGMEEEEGYGEDPEDLQTA